MSKHKIITYLLAGVLLFQTACGVNTLVGTTEESASSVETEQEGEGQDVEQESEGHTSNQPTEEGKGDETLELPESNILNERQQLDDAGVLWYIPNERVEENLQQQLLLFEDKLLLWGTGLGSNEKMALKLALLSMETGEVLHEAELTGFDIPDLQLCGDRIAAIDWSNGEVYLLDNSLHVIKEFQADAEYCTIYLNPDATKVYCFTQNDGVRITDMTTGSTEVILQNGAGLFPSNRYGNFVTVTYTDKETQMAECEVVDLTTGTTEQIPFAGAFYNIGRVDDLWIAGVYGEENLYYLGKSERPHAFYPHQENAMVSMLDESARLLISSYQQDGTSIMALYETDGSFVSECKLDMGGAALYYAPVWSETDGGYFFTVTDASGKDVLMFWDLAAPIAGEDLQLESQYVDEALAGSVVSQALYDRAASISEEYGVEIRIAEQCEEAYSDFVVARELAEGYISSGLDSLEKVLSAYPEGFIEQLLHGYQQKIEINLVGELTKVTVATENVSGFTVFSGFANEEVTKSVIYVDITRPGSLEKTLYHEMTHLIDYKLAFDASIREDAVYSEKMWAELNPEGFVYAETYDTIPMEYYTDGHEEWFVDIYSRTFAKEDRARILEQAMMGSDWIFASSPGRLAKLEYLSCCIRDAFDTTDWPEVTVWEETLERCSP